MNTKEFVENVVNLKKRFSALTTPRFSGSVDVTGFVSFLLKILLPFRFSHLKDCCFDLTGQRES